MALHAFEQFKDQNQSPEKVLDIQLEDMPPPRTELHVHVDGGAVTKQMIETLAQRNGMVVPEDLFDEQGRIQYQRKAPGQIFSSLSENPVFDSFIQAYDRVSKFIVTPQDYTDITFDYLERCHFEGVKLVNLMFSFDHIKQVRAQYLGEGKLSSVSAASDLTQNMTYQEFVNAIFKGIENARTIYGIEAHITMALLGHNGPPACEETLNEIEKYPHPAVVGIDLVGVVRDEDLSHFKDLYVRAKSLGLLTAVHVGEHNGPDEISKVLEDFKPDILSHGIRAVEDQGIIDYLRTNQIGCTVCLTSNIELAVYANYQSHPFKRLLDEGVLISMNSDDPSFWGTTIGKEYELAKEHGKLNFDQMCQLSRNGITTSFVEEPLRNKLLAHLDLYQSYHALKGFACAIEDKTLQGLCVRYGITPSLAISREMLNHVATNTEVTTLAAKALIKCMIKFHNDYIEYSMQYEMAYQHRKEDFANGKKCSQMTL